MTAVTIECTRGGDPHQWARPGVYAVAEGVFRIPLPLPDVGLRAVNAYVLLDADGAVIIDAGQATAAGWSALMAGLRSLELTIRDVSRVLVTHIHRDHYTQAVALRRAHGARIVLGDGERRSLALVRDAANDRLHGQLRLLHSSGAADIATAVRNTDDGVAPDLWEEPDDWLSGWTELPMTERTLTAVPTPGHTRGHLVFRDAQAALLFAGDHVLPTITPSIGFEPDLASRPLADYLQSLRLVRGFDDAWLLPAHGAVTDSVHARVDELLEHHAQRLESTYLSLGPNVETATEVAGRLAWTRRSRRLEELSPFDRMLAVLETRAHLDVLVDRGRLQSRIDVDGVERYSRV